MRSRKIPVLLYLFVGLVTLIAACAPAAAPEVQPGTVSEGAVQPEKLEDKAEVVAVVPAIQLISADIINGDLIAETKTTAFTLDPEAIGKANVEGRGHWHLYVDGKLAGLSAMDKLTVGKDKLAEFGGGIHEIKVELHNNDHSVVSETAWASTKMDFGPSLMGPGVSVPTIRLVSANIADGNLVVEAMVTGFILDPEAIGMANVEGQGHWHLYIDGKLAGFSAMEKLTIEKDKLAEYGGGLHDIKIELHNNDHSPISETAWASTRLDFDVSMKAPEVSRDYTVDGYSY